MAGDDDKRRPILGSAPRAKRTPSGLEAGVDHRPTASPDARPELAGEFTNDLRARVEAQVAELVRVFETQVARALGVSLDGSITSLAFVDHYLRLAKDEDRAPILALLAAGAGAYYGEMVRREIGGNWVGDGEDPRRLRLLLSPAFVHFCPVDQALEAIAGEALDDDDPRVLPGPPFDDAFGLAPPRRRADGSIDDERSWLQEELAQISAVPEDEFYSLTCRFETLQLMLELLAARSAAEGRSPREHTLAEYLEVFAG